MFFAYLVFAWNAALTMSVVVIAQILPHIDARHRVRPIAQLISNRTLANHATFCVDAPAILADASRLHAFVHV